MELGGLEWKGGVKIWVSCLRLTLGIGALFAVLRMIVWFSVVTVGSGIAGIVV